MSDPPGPQSAVLRLFFTDEGQVSEGKQVVQGLPSIFSSRKVSPCLPPSNSASLHSCHLFVCLLPSPSVSVSLVPSPQSLSLPSSPVPSRPEGAGLSWGPLAVGDCQSFNSDIEPPGPFRKSRARASLFIMGTQREEGQTQDGRWGSEKNGESQTGFRVGSSWWGNRV